MKANWMDPSFLPKRKRAITRQLADELLVYETKTKRAHCLDATAGEIWRMCDGTKTAAQIAQAMRKEQQLLIDENSIRLTLARFAKAGLLQNSKRIQASSIDARRRFLQAGTAATMLALPSVTSVFIPKAEQAVSCSTLGQPCNPRPCCGILTCALHICV
jgi:hypothetical protein